MASRIRKPRRRRLEVEDIGDVTVVNFVDRKILDEQNVQVIGEQLFSLVDDSGRYKLLLNFHNVEYLSSTALGKLITFNKKLQAAGGKLVLCEISPTIYEVFEITRLDKFFTIRDREEAGLQAMKGALPPPPPPPPEPHEFNEGALLRRDIKSYVRNAKARKACIEQFGTTCFICRFDFGTFCFTERPLKVSSTSNISRRFPK
jgi:anti-sigma B factor antagonist